LTSVFNTIHKLADLLALNATVLQADDRTMGTGVTRQTCPAQTKHISLTMTTRHTRPQATLVAECCEHVHGKWEMNIIKLQIIHHRI